MYAVVVGISVVVENVVVMVDFTVVDNGDTIVDIFVETVDDIIFKVVPD